MDIARFLPNDHYQAALSANAPTALNPFATTADLTNALAGYLKLDGTTPMTGDLDMLINGVAVRTDDVKTSLGVLDLFYG